MNVLYVWFSNPLALALLALLPVLAALGLWARRQRRRALAQFGNLPLPRPAGLGRLLAGTLRTACLAAGLVFLTTAIAGPRWGRDWEQATARGRDLVVVLDMSRSMLAEDVLPNRFERARRALEDLSYTIQQRGGHRLALVVFAARAQIVCPLTHDYDHFRVMLENLDLVHLPAGLRPENRDAVSGTRIGAGLEAAILALDEVAAGYQDMLLVSDGDDPAQDGEWRTGAEAARRLRIPVHTVGVGNPDEASPIPGRSGEPLRHNRELVRTRLEEEPLRAIAGLTGGTYTPARTNTLPLGELFRDRIEPGQVRENTQDTLPLYQQRYSWFLTAAFALLTFELMAGGGSWRIIGSKHHSADRT